MDPSEIDLFWRPGVALTLGLLIGLERGWQGRHMSEGDRVAGFRTCAIVGLLGGISALLGERLGPSIIIGIAGALTAFLALGYWRTMSSRDDLSATTAIAVLVTFALGVLAGLGQAGPAIAAAIIMTVLLGYKAELHGLLQRLDRNELLATLQLLLISLVLLPLLPNEGFGPWQALNPYKLWWLVVLIAGLSYAGYFAIRVLGTKRGIVITGLLGGMVSSTAVAINLSRLSRERPEAAKLLAAGTVGAATVLFPRILVMVAILAPHLIAPLLQVLAPATIVGGATVFWLALRSGAKRHEATSFAPSNPLNLPMALKFGALLAGLSLLARGAEEQLGAAGVLVVAALSGIANVDAITLSLTTGGAETRLDGRTVVLAITLAAAVNTAAKAAIALMLGDRRMGLQTASGLGLILGAVLVAAAIVLRPL